MLRFSGLWPVAIRRKLVLVDSASSYCDFAILQFLELFVEWSVVKNRDSKDTEGHKFFKRIYMVNSI